MAEKEYIEREEAKKVLAFDYAYAAAKLLDTVPTSDVQEVRHAIIMGKIALKRKLRLKPKNVSDDGIERYVCANCNNLMHRKQHYCDKCGQALDWSDDI